ncbi:MAG: hypothetical protein NTY32_11225 [Bacteroidia bacterium]|nr:hypothetical protein [Bacteroidia bacterium]
MKNNYLLKVLFTLFLCGSFSMSDAAVYSISVAGNDVSGTGSALSPWASFSMAQTAAASGDTIQVSGMIDMWSDPANLTFASILPAGSFSTTNKTGILITKSLTIQGTSSAMDGFDGKSNLDGTNTTRLFQLSDPLVTLTLKNLKLVNGAAKTDITTVSSGGGAILMLNGNIVAENVLFDSNLAVGHSALAGAVLYITNTNALGTTFKNCVFSNNAADKTGAIYINALAAGTASAPSVLKFEGCSFIANESRLAFGGSAIFLRLGSVYTTVSMINCTIAKNKVSVAANGGAVYLYSGKISTVVNLINCTITENTAAGSAGNGAGVYFPNNVSACQATLNIQNSIIEGNTAAGGVYSDINIYATPPVPGTTPVTYSAGPPVVGTTGFLSVNNSIVGRNGSTATIPTGCIGANSSFGYLTSTSSSNALKAGLAPFDATNNVYPLYTGSLAINYGASTYLTTLLPPVTTDQLNNVRTVGATNHAGAVETATVATTTPSAPTSLVATAGTGQISVAFSTGATGGSLVAVVLLSQIINILPMVG